MAHKRCEWPAATWTRGPVLTPPQTSSQLLLRDDAGRVSALQRAPPRRNVSVSVERGREPGWDIRGDMFDDGRGACRQTRGSISASIRVASSAPGCRSGRTPVGMDIGAGSQDSSRASWIHRAAGGRGAHAGASGRDIQEPTSQRRLFWPARATGRIFTRDCAVRMTMICQSR